MGRGAGASLREASSSWFECGTGVQIKSQCSKLLADVGQVMALSGGGGGGGIARSKQVCVNLDRAGLASDALSQLLAAIPRIKGLVSLDVRHNALGNEGVESLLVALQVKSRLRV